MKRHKLYLLISIITILCLFITAATCSFCGKQIAATSSEETKMGVIEDTGETELKKTETNKETTQNTDPTQSDDEDSDNTVPMISLAISEGPTYSAADDVCYYRIKATVTGSPKPKIKWSTDYSNGSLGKDVAQVNLKRDNPTYTLTATASNSAGSDTDTIILNWGCDGENADNTDEETIGPEEENEESEGETFGEGGGESTVTTLSVDKFNSGYIVGEGILAESRGNILFGDNDQNEQIKGYMSFDIRPLPDMEIIGAKLKISGITKVGSPTFGIFSISRSSFGTFDIEDWNWGDVAPIIHPETEELTSINIDNEYLATTIQQARDHDDDLFQLLFLFDEDSDNDENNDYFIINPDNVKLYVSQ